VLHVVGDVKAEDVVSVNLSVQALGLVVVPLKCSENLKLEIILKFYLV
jgi:hypothetical protein